MRIADLRILDDTFTFTLLVSTGKGSARSVARSGFPADYAELERPELVVATILKTGFDCSSGLDRRLE